MKTAFACLIALALPLFVASQQQQQIDDQRWNEIRMKHQRGEKITEEERDYYESLVERTNQAQSAVRQVDWAKAHPAHESTTMPPLPDLGTGMYKGEQGGLYPGGANEPPKAHLEAGLKLAKQIVPLDAQGHPSANGRIVMCTIGMSNTTQETRSFLRMAIFDPGLNPKLKLVDCAQGAQTAA